MDGELYRLFHDDFARQYELTASLVAGVRGGYATEPPLVAAATEAMERFLVDAARRFETMRRQPDSPAARELAERLVTQHRVYSTPLLPKFECNYITDQIIAGRNPLTGHDIDWLRVQGVTAILDLRERWEWTDPGRYGEEAVEAAERYGGLCPRHHLPIEDANVPIAARVLTEAVDFLGDTLKYPFEKVYVHCRAGHERTAAVLIAYMARRDGSSYDVALAALRERRPELGPRPEQEASVRKWVAVNVPF